MIRSDNINKGVLMIKLESVGTALTRQLNTHPIMADGTIDRDEGTTTHVYDLDNEWYCNLSDTDLLEFFDFIEETQELGLNNIVYNEWKTSIWGMWEEHNNCFLNLEAK
jgi:hypothetical protein